MLLRLRGLQFGILTLYPRHRLATAMSEPENKGYQLAFSFEAACGSSGSMVIMRLVMCRLSIGGSRDRTSVKMVAVQQLVLFD